MRRWECEPSSIQTSSFGALQATYSLFCALRQREGVLAAVEEQDRRFTLPMTRMGRARGSSCRIPAGRPRKFRTEQGKIGRFFGLHVQLEGFQKRCEQAFNHEMGDIGRKVRLCGCQHDGGAAKRRCRAAPRRCSRADRARSATMR